MYFLIAISCLFILLPYSLPCAFSSSPALLHTHPLSLIISFAVLSRPYYLLFITFLLVVFVFGLLILLSSFFRSSLIRLFYLISSLLSLSILFVIFPCLVLMSFLLSCLYSFVFIVPVSCSLLTLTDTFLSLFFSIVLKPCFHRFFLSPSYFSCLLNCQYFTIALSRLLLLLCCSFCFCYFPFSIFFPPFSDSLALFLMSFSLVPYLSLHLIVTCFSYFSYCPYFFFLLPTPLASFSLLIYYSRFCPLSFLSSLLYLILYYSISLQLPILPFSSRLLFSSFPYFSCHISILFLIYLSSIMSLLLAQRSSCLFLFASPSYHLFPSYFLLSYHCFLLTIVFSFLSYSLFSLLSLRFSCLLHSLPLHLILFDSSSTLLTFSFIPLFCFLSLTPFSRYALFVSHLLLFSSIFPFLLTSRFLFLRLSVSCFLPLLLRLFCFFLSLLLRTLLRCP